LGNLRFHKPSCCSLFLSNTQQRNSPPNIVQRTQFLLIVLSCVSHSSPKLGEVPQRGGGVCLSIFNSQFSIFNLPTPRLLLVASSWHLRPLFDFLTLLLRICLIFLATHSSSIPPDPRCSPKLGELSALLTEECVPSPCVLQFSIFNSQFPNCP